MKKSDKKEYVFTTLSELLKPQGYNLIKTGLDPRFVLKEDNRVILFFFNFLDRGTISFSNIMISLPSVEKIMFELGGIPTNNYSSIDEKKYFLITVEDKYTDLPSIESPRKSVSNYIDSQEKLIECTNEIINYLLIDGKEFIEKYSYLPNILLEMDKLESEGKYWKEILAGGPEFLMRGLIISKLCNDSNFDKKLVYVKDLYISMADEFIPYLEKLKERLKTVEPIYNI